MIINNRRPKLIKPGFTLIELIAVIGIVTIVMATAYSMHAFGLNYFYKGDTKSNIQTNLRNDASYISKEIRYSSNVKILEASDLPDFTIAPGAAGGPEVGTIYIYISNGKLKKYSAGVSDNIFGSTIDNIVTTLRFDKKDYETVYFKLLDTSKGETYTIDSSIVLLNIGDGVIGGIDTGAAISYKPGQAEVSNVIKPVTSITVSGPSSVIVGGNITLTSSVLPTDASIKDVIWSVDDTSKASISTAGILTGIAAGTVNVTATASDGSGVYSTKYPVTVAR